MVVTIGMVLADEPTLQKIGYFLQEKPETWHMIPPGNEVYDSILEDTSLFLNRNIDDPTIFLSMTHRWLFIRERSHLIPIIWINRSGYTSFFRLLAGKNAAWLKTLDELLGTIAVRARPEKELPPAFTGGAPTKLNWPIGGFIKD